MGKLNLTKLGEVIVKNDKVHVRVPQKDFIIMFEFLI